MVLGHGLVGDDRALGARPQRLDALAERGEQPAADDDVVGARAQRDLTTIGSAARLAQRRDHGLLSARRDAERLRQLGDDFVDDGVVRLVARLHVDVGQRIDRLAQRQQVLDLVGQRTVVAPLGALHQHVEIGLQPDRDAFDVDQVAGVLVHDRRRRRSPAPAGRCRAAARSRAPRRRGNRPRRAWRRFPEWSCRRRSRSRCRRRRTESPAARPAGGRPTTCRRPSCRPARWNGAPARARSPLPAPFSAAF